MGKWIAAREDVDGGIEVWEYSFLPRYPTDGAYDWEYYDAKRGTGKMMHRVYRYAEATDYITVWTVGQDGFSTERLESTFEFGHPQQERGKYTAVAVLIPSSNEGQDVEGLDVFRFHFAGSSLKTWTMGMVSQPGVAPLNFVRIGTI